LPGNVCILEQLVEDPLPNRRRLLLSRPAQRAVHAIRQIIVGLDTQLPDSLRDVLNGYLSHGFPRQN
jgi:hypothetical protein